MRILDAWQCFNLLAEAGASNWRDFFARCRGQRFLLFSIDSDGAFPRSEQGTLLRHLKSAQIPAVWIAVHSDKGHDSFLLEPHLYAPYLKLALE